MSNISSVKVSCSNNRTVFLFRISNHRGAFVELTNYGATLVSIVVPDRTGQLGNVILNYPATEDYFSDSCYLGSTVGRFANRIADASFELNGKPYIIDRNDGLNSNHGGFNGFNRKVFDYKIAENSVIFSLESPDGEGGFPGKLRFSVRYTFSDANELTIEYRAISDKETILNPTNHAYFNLSGGKESIIDHELMVFADRYLESTEAFIPTGRILDVSGTAFDFRAFRNIGEAATLKSEQIKGYNTYFISPEQQTANPKQLASLKDNKSGRQLEVFSTMPGIQIYTGDYLCGHNRPFDGICLEAQFYPDSPNHSTFPSCAILPYSEYKYLIKYAFKATN